LRQTGVGPTDWSSLPKQAGGIAAGLLAVGTLLAALGLLPPTQAQIKELRGQVATLQDRFNEQAKATVRIEERQRSLGRQLDLIYDALCWAKPGRDAQ